MEDHLPSYLNQENPKEVHSWLLQIGGTNVNLTTSKMSACLSHVEITSVHKDTQSRADTSKIQQIRELLMQRSNCITSSLALICSESGLM